MDRQLLYLVLLFIVGCGEGEKKESNIFFAGEIVNPTDSKVFLYKGDAVIDSAALDEQNRFAFSIDSIEDGLYHFNHYPELQYVYLERGDSLMMRLNTIDFDESLIFSGKGEEINNFLLELFLSHEDEADLIRELYRLEPTDFTDKIDSLQEIKLDELAKLVNENKISEKKEKVAKASIVYNYNTFKEKYPFKHKWLTGAQKIVSLPTDFYSYRKNLTFNDKDLTYLRPYYNFMNTLVGNMSFMSCYGDCGEGNEAVRNRLHFNKHKLKLIDSLMQEKELKDNLFRFVAFDYLLKAHQDSEKNNEEFIEEFHRLSNNNRHMDEIDALYESIKNMQPNKRIPDVLVSDVDGNQVSLKQIASKNNKTVFYFWSGTNRSHFDNLRKRVAYLSHSKPNYSFVGINLKTTEPVWKTMLETSGLDKSLQYRAVDVDNLSKSLIIDKLNKCIITEDEIIVDAFANVYESF
ncbi:transaldolase [Pareuzebyella sediminis]|uniref:transaldolase n=1 Tax=Pareuzebyella sediminis TaxID=2607998 RepID=UPI0011ED7709|nr:transaldolase [Pareuzebyella sediminis]